MSFFFFCLFFLNSACQQGSIGNRMLCYKMFTSPKTWENAKKECEKRHARLVKVESLEENDFIKTKILPTDTNDEYWIGVSDSASENDWIWTDGTQLGSDGYKNWGDKQPDNRKKKHNCVLMQIRKSNPDHNGKWHDQRCSKERKFICENP